MQRFDRPLSFGEIFDRAITLVVSTLPSTIPIAVLLYFVPALIVQVFRNVAHPRGFAAIALMCLTYLFNALSDVGILAVFLRAFNGARPSRSAIAASLRRYGFKSVALSGASLVPIFIGAVLLYIPRAFWRFTETYHSGVGEAILVVATLPFAAFGLALVQVTSLFAQTTLAIMIGEDTRLRAAIASARRRLLTRSLRPRNFLIAVVLAVFTILDLAIDQWSNTLPYASSEFLRLLIGWPFGIYELGVATVLNRDARIRLEGFDIEQRLAVLSDEVRAIDLA